MRILLNLLFAVFFFLGNHFSVSAGNDSTDESNEPAEKRQITQPYQFNHPYLEKGDSLNKAKNYEASYIAYKKAEKLFKNEENWEGVANALLKFGISYFENREFEKAIEIFEEGESLCSEKLPEKPGLKSSYLFFHGSSYRYMKKGDKALEQLGKCIALRLETYGKWNSATARTYIEIGNVYQFVLGNYYKAEKNHKIALDILETNGLEPKASLKFRLYYNLSNSTKAKYDNQKALIYALKCLRILESGEYNNEAYKEYCYKLIADCYFKLREFENAKLFFNKAIVFNRNLPKGNTFLLANYLNSLGLLYRDLDQHNAAIKNFRNAQYLLEGLKSKSLNARKELGNTYRYLGNAYLYGNDKNIPAERVLKQDSSIFYIKKGIRIHEKYFSTSMEGCFNYFSLGDYFYNWDILDSAFHYTNYALGFFVEDREKLKNNDIAIEDIESNVRSLIFLRNLLRTSFLIYKENPKANYHYLQKSYRLSKIADKMVTELSGDLQRQNDQLTFNEKNKQIYEYGLAGLWELQKLHPQEAKYKKEFVEMMAKSKAKLLSKAFAKAESINQVGLPLELIEREKNIEYEIYFYENLLKNVLEEKMKSVIYDSLFQLDIEKDKLLTVFKKDYPHYYQLKYQSENYDVTELKKYSSKTNSLIIEYFWGKDFNYGVGIFGNGIEIFEIDKKVEFNVLGYLSTLANGIKTTNPTRTFETFTSNSYALYNSLIVPALSSKEFDNLIIVPDGVLAYIPFESLISDIPESSNVDYKNLSYLINDYTTSYVYSSDFILKNNLETKGNPEVLAFSFTDPKELKENTAPAFYRRNLGMLLGAPMEIMAISKMFEGNYFMGENATESNFKQSANAYDIIHLAIHGYAERGDKGDAYLVFRDSLDSDEDGVLYDYELFNLQLKASLTFLSACESGVGKVQEGEGVLSMGRGFAYSGCPSIIMSLWQVHDKFALEIVDEFYKNIDQHKPVNKSLRNAKIKYLEKADERTAHPSYWAPLVFVGQPNLKYGNNLNLVYYSIGILGIVLLAGFFIRKKIGTKKNSR